jgi:hypothetical protein
MVVVLMLAVAAAQAAQAAMSLLLRQILHPMVVQDCNLVSAERPHTMLVVAVVWDSHG